jgi:CheY-like chemotaxis protein
MSDNLPQFFETQGGRVKAVLVVEDNNTLRFLVKKQLVKLGLQCDMACDGAEAVSKAHEKKYDLILMDVQMPNMSGLEASRKIRDEVVGPNSLNTDTPIIAVTANPDSKQCYEAGMNDFLFKPVSIKQLDEAVKRWLAIPPAA